ncbi:hypothetical protein WJX77_003298 [Trebouxia sp. C0004]
MTGGSSPTEVDWQKLDKTKFIVVGAGLFSGVTTCLFPLTVIKTRQMAVQGAPTGLWGAKETARVILKTDGVPGLYRGFGTVVFGAIPSRIVYLTTLEAMKSVATPFANRISANETQAAGAANFIAGAVASLVTQSIIVPVDVVSQRLMVNDRPSQPTPTPKTHPSSSTTSSNGSQKVAMRQQDGQHPTFRAIAQKLIAEEGPKGLLRGVAPRITSTALWSTCMVTTYEFLKRTCLKPEFRDDS